MVAVVCAGLLGSAYVYITVDASGRSHILDRASTIAEVIPSGQVLSLDGSRDDEGTFPYLALKTLFSDVREVNSDIRFIYLIGQKDDDSLFFYVDSEPESSEDLSPPGQVYEEATPAMYKLFETGVRVTEGPDRDRWGVWISGYAPLFDDSGRVIALLGIDLPADNYLFNLYLDSMLPLLFALALLAFFFMIERTRMREALYIEQKGELLSIASHEIRTPLTGVRWATEEVMNDTSSKFGEESRNMLTLIHKNILSVIDRINTLLEVNAVENSSRAHLHKDDVSLSELVDGIVASLTLPAREHKVSLLVDSSVTAAGAIRGKREMLHQALFNLVANAVKYTKQGTTVTVTYERKGQMQNISIKDEGDGISAEEQERIFEGFHRTDAASASGEEGTGLGLYLVKKVAELHGGEVRIESQKGQGSTFIFSLPE